MISLFAAAPHWAVPAGAGMALGAAALPLLCWVVRRVRRRRWSFNAGSSSWRTAVALLLTCGALAGTVTATVLLVADAQRIVSRPSGPGAAGDHGDVMVALQRSLGANLAWRQSVYRWPDELTPSAVVDVLSGGAALVDGECEVRYDDARGDALAGRDVSSLVDDTQLPADEKASAYGLWCDGVQVESRDDLRGVRLETEQGPGGWTAAHLLRVYAVGLTGGLAVHGLLIYVLYIIGPRRGSDVARYRIVREADDSLRRQGQRDALQAQWELMAADPQERARVESLMEETERDVLRAASGAGTAAGGRRLLWAAVRGSRLLTIDPAIVALEDRIVADYLRATGQDPDNLLGRPRDPYVRGFFLAMLSLPGLVLAAWLASNVEEAWEFQ